MKPDLDKFSYVNVGLWDKKTQLKFYKQYNKNYVSQSLIENMFGTEYDIVNTDTIKNIMNAFGHTEIDLMKLDIEGAEIKTINKMLDDNIFPKYLLVEFDLLLKNKDFNNETKQLINRLINNHNYSIFKNDNLNISFIRN